MNTVELVKSLCRERKISIHRLESDLGFSNGYISQLRKGMFPADRLAKIADYFGVSTDFLLGAEKEKAPSEDGERKSDTEIAKIALFGGDTEVTDEMWEEAMLSAEIIKEKYKRKKKG